MKILPRIYLQRHAEAESGERMDPTRALTETGKRQIKTMGEFLVRQIGRVDLVISSPFVRALDTARGMAQFLLCGPPRASTLRCELGSSHFLRRHEISARDQEFGVSTRHA